MKKAMMIVAVVLMGLTSCKKESVEPIKVQDTTGCNCGTVVKVVQTPPNTDPSESVPAIVYISNNCSLKEEGFVFNEVKKVGDKVCLDSKW